MRPRIRTGNEGFAMLLVMIYIFLAATIVAITSTGAVAAFRSADAFDASRKALQAAEYAEVRCIEQFVRNGSVDRGVGEWRRLQTQASATGAVLPAFDAPGVVSAPAGDTGGVCIADASPFTSTATDAAPELVVVRAAGRCGNAEHRIEAVYRIEPAKGDGSPRSYARKVWREVPVPNR